MISSILDEYSLQARLRPALLVLLPLFITVAVWNPAIYNIGTGLISLMVACGLTTVLSHMARERGRITQSKLIQQWGALPTTLWLRHSNNSLDKQTKGTSA